jgi:hypothetical protein
MNKKLSKTKLMVIVSITIMLVVQLNQFWEPESQNVTSDFLKDETSTHELTSGLSDNEPIMDIPAIDQRYFTENLGQWKGHIQYLGKTSFGSVAFSTNSVYYNILAEDQGHVMKIAFLTQHEVKPLGVSQLDFENNYFYGNDPEKWVSSAKSYKEILYEDVWPGIDILYYFKDGNLKYDISVDRYSDPDVISFEVEGHEGLKISEEGLEISLSEGFTISDSDLIAFHEDSSQADIGFTKKGDNTYGFDVNKVYGLQLTIDPVVFSKSTFLGGSNGEAGNDLAVDSSGNIIVVGMSSSDDFPNTTGAFQPIKSNFHDVIVTKMYGDTSGIIFSTFLGGTSGEYGYGVEVDTFDDIYLTGSTTSTAFPTTFGSYQAGDPSPGFPDAFVTKLSSQGDQLVYSSYVGGTGSDSGRDIKVLNGNAYVTGNALSYDFPYVTQPVSDAHGTVFLFIMNQDGTDLTHAGFWGGWSNEFGYSLDIANNGDVVIGGVSYSEDFPTTSGVYMTKVNDTNNAILLKYRPSTDSLVWSTYIGAFAGEKISSIYVDDSSNIYFAGETTIPSGGAPSYPTTPGAFDTILNGSKDIFVTKMDPDGTTLIYSTYLGGDGEEEPGNIDVDMYGNLILTGKITSDVNFTITSDCFDDSYNGGDDAFLAVLSPDGSNLIYSSFLGGNQSDSATAVVIADSSTLLVVGTTASMDFPVTNGSYQTINKGGGDIFVTKFLFGNIAYLNEGWNLISIPFLQDDPFVDAVLSSISGSYDAVQWYDADDPSDPWKHHHTSKPAQLNDLQMLDHLKGIWVHINHSGGVYFEYKGDPLPPGASIPLKDGWNLVGYPSKFEYNRDFGLGNLNFGSEIDAIQWYDAETKTWHFMESTDSFVPGRGYWMHSLGNNNWDIP